MENLAIVVPCYNEEAILVTANELLLNKIENLIKKKIIGEDSFILYVDDGSSDDTWKKIKRETQESQYVYGLKLARNVGHQNALTAGLIAVKDIADISISIDADLQDDIAVIEEMIEKYKDGNDIVYGVRNDRSSDSFFKRTSAQLFYKAMKLMGIKTIYNHADFRLMSKRALAEFAKYQETNIFLRGLIPLMGFKSTSVFYERKQRMAGESKYQFNKMISLAFEGITSFTIRPISMVFILGVIIVLVSICAGIYALISYALGRVVAGWTSLILSIWFLGGVQLLSIGLIGTYVGKVYMEVKHRPRYNIEYDGLNQVREKMDNYGESVTNN